MSTGARDELHAHHDERAPGRATVGGGFDVLEAAETLQLLGSTTVGRLAFAGESHVEIVPVNFAYRDGVVLVRTSPHSVLGRLAEGVDDVAFEIDHHGSSSRTGFSVVVLGRVEAVTDVDEIERLWSSARPSPWAAGVRPLFLRMVPTSVTGRAVTPG